MPGEEPKPDEVELIDDWLASMEGQGVICHPRHLEIFFPMTHPRSYQALQQLMETVGEIFRGATVYDGTGYWCEHPPCTELENVEIEPVKVVSIWHHCTSEDDRKKFARALKRAEDMTGQQWIAVKGTNKFYSISRERYRVKYKKT